MYTPKKAYFYGTGRRKSSVARVRLFPGGTGEIKINNRSIDNYFGLETLKMVCRPQSRSSRASVQQALIGVSNWFKNAQKPRKTAVFRGFSISHLLFQLVCFWQDLNCSDPVFLD